MSSSGGNVNFSEVGDAVCVIEADYSREGFENLGGIREFVVPTDGVNKSLFGDAGKGNIAMIG